MNAREVYLKGNEAFASCNYEQALSFFLSILDKALNDEGLLLKISQCYQELSKYDEAIEFLERLLNLNIERGNYKRSIAICKRILSIDPDDTDVILKLANIFRKLNQYGEASYYYKIVAQHYEYAGFMDKAIEILQIIKELGQEGVEDLLDIVKKEYKRGAKSKVDQNIDSIIAELKNGSEYNLLDVALNLALTNAPENMSYINDLTGLYFRTGRLVSCVHLCLWGIRQSTSESPIFTTLVKSLWALGYEDIAKKLCESVLNGEWPLDSKEAKANIKKIHTSIIAFDREKLRMEEEKDEQSIKNQLEDELKYLEEQDFTQVDHMNIEHDIIKKEFDARLENLGDQKTSIIDTKKKIKMSSRRLDEISEAEILMSEGLYDRASQKLFTILEDEPGNPDIKALLEKAIKLSSNMDPVQAKIQAEHSEMTTDEMISELEKYMKDRNVDKDYQQDLVENMEVKGIVELFNSRINDILLPDDYKTIFDLGIAYMELELWDEAAEAFKRVMDYLSSNSDDMDKLTESKIYYAYSSARSEKHKDLATSIQFLNKLLTESIYDRYKLDVLYYLAICYEMNGDITNARNTYLGISSIDPSYRDVDIRLTVIGK